MFFQTNTLNNTFLVSGPRRKTEDGQRIDKASVDGAVQRKESVLFFFQLCEYYLLFW